MGLFGSGKKNKANENILDRYVQIEHPESNFPAVSDTAIDSGAIVSRFGTDRVGATKYLAHEKGLSLKEATRITTQIYSSYLNTLAATWQPTQKVNRFFEIDEANRLFAIAQPVNLTGTKMQLCATCSFDEVLNYELLEDGNSVTSGGLGAAAAGGLLFGGAGAIVGSVAGKKRTKREITSLRIKITKKGINNAPLYINLLTTKTKNGSIIYTTAYNEAQQILSVLDQISSEQSPEEASTQNKLSPADEIRKYKELLDDGILTQEEFDAKKKDLLKL